MNLVNLEMNLSIFTQKLINLFIDYLQNLVKIKKKRNLEQLL